MTFRCGMLPDNEYPIFDVRYIKGTHYEHRHRIGFTGKTYKLLYIQFYLFRYQIYLDFEWSHDNINPIDAKRLYHARRTKNEQS